MGRDAIGAPGRRARLTAAVQRDGGTCVWCGRPFGPFVRPTTDHVVPRVKGGPSWAENELAACARCNRERGHASSSDWLAECERRGWRCDASRVIGTLRQLDRAIRDRGGQRRARPYLAGQLRRVARHPAG